MAEWLPIYGFPAYEISDEGQVRSLRFDPPKIIRQRLANTGYLRVALYRNRGPEDQNVRALMADRNRGPENADVHVLMAKVFHGEPHFGEEVHHLNGVKTDNRAENIAWGTRLENVGDMMEAGTHYLLRYVCGECELTSTGPEVASHQRQSGHRGRTPVEEE